MASILNQQQKFTINHQNYKDNDMDTEDTFSQASYSTDAKQGLSQSQDKIQSRKSKDILGFINQKYKDWPQWNKFQHEQQQKQKLYTQLAKQTKLNKVSGTISSKPVQSQFQIQSKTQLSSPKQAPILSFLYTYPQAIPLKDLPWIQFRNRCRVTQLYDFYHCKEDGMTYFYLTRKAQWSKSDGNIHRLINSPPEGFKAVRQAYNFFMMETDKAKVLLKERSFQLIDDRYQ